MPAKRDDGLAATDSKVRQRYSEPSEAGDALFALIDGVRSGWSVSDTLSWLRERVVFPGWLRKRDSRALTLELGEPEVGTITVPLLGQLDRAAAAKVDAIVRAAVARIVAELRAHRDRPSDRLVRDAIDAGRVKQVDKRGGGEMWGAVLREGEPLSTWLATLAAADMIAGIRDYAKLGVCEDCDRAWFGGTDRRRCVDHRRR